MTAERRSDDSLAQAADLVAAAHRQVDEHVRALRSGLEQLLADWRGERADAFGEVYRAFDAQAGRIGGALTQLHARLSA
jgi:WXG100 family type VII secretion target